MPSLAVRSTTGAAALLLSAALLSACEAGSADPEGGTGEEGTASASASESAAAEVAGIRINVERGARDVPVDTLLRIAATHGRLSTVTVTGGGDVGTLEGSISGDGGVWKTDDRLEPATTYAVEATVRGTDGDVVKRRSRFTTRELSLDQQTYPSVAPLAGETVGVGMPVIVNFDVPVTDRASFEQHMTVTSTPAQVGGWYWLSDQVAHYRPKKYWKAGTQVSVDVDINSVPAGGGIYGQESRQVDFTVGDAHVYKVDMDAHHMEVLSNGKLLRTLPVTTGEEPKFTTRSGIKVIMEKYDAKRMNSETVGIPADSADGYDIDNVQWAMRVTSSGEFIHAAPWSVGSQGSANVSHGCTGMSTDNADWLYHMSVRGDVVEYVGTDRDIEPGNGWSDWNLSWSEYQEGSALASDA
jgi:lipoprotein-anchoring transpeptidase ErfK/SrfK